MYVSIAIKGLVSCVRLLYCYPTIRSSPLR